MLVFSKFCYFFFSILRSTKNGQNSKKSEFYQPLILVNLFGNFVCCLSILSIRSLAMSALLGPCKTWKFSDTASGVADAILFLVTTMRVWLGTRFCRLSVWVLLPKKIPQLGPRHHRRSFIWRAYFISGVNLSLRFEPGFSTSGLQSTNYASIPFWQEI